MKNNYKFWFSCGALIMFLIMILFFKMCHKPCKDCNETVKIDTLKTTDTIWKEKIINLVKYCPQPKDSIKILVPDSTTCQYSRIYTDSIIREHYNLYYNAITRGQLDYIGIDCRLKVPVSVENTIIKYDTIKQINYFRRHFFYGCQFGIHGAGEALGVIPSIMYQNEKKGYCFGVGYDITYKNKIFYLLFNFKKNKK